MQLMTVLVFQRLIADKVALQQLRDKGARARERIEHMHMW